MSALAVLKAWLSGGLPTTLLPHLKLDHWTVSKDGQAIGPVTAAKIGLKDGSDFWGSFAFHDGPPLAPTATLLLDVTRPLAGGAATITFNGQEVPGHVAFATHLHGFPPQVKIEVDVVIDGAGRYRFDAVVED